MQRREQVLPEDAVEFCTRFAKFRFSPGGVPSLRLMTVAGCAAIKATGHVNIIACMEDLAVIERILVHLNRKAPSIGKAMLPEDPAPPQLFD